MLPKNLFDLNHLSKRRRRRRRRRGRRRRNTTGLMAIAFL
jgi:hypothetical protein